MFFQGMTLDHPLPYLVVVMMVNLTIAAPHRHGCGEGNGKEKAGRLLDRPAVLLIEIYSSFLLSSSFVLASITTWARCAGTTSVWSNSMLKMPRPPVIERRVVV